MAEYEGRETKYASQMGEQIKAFLEPVIQGDGHAKDVAAHRMLLMLGADNAHLHAMMSLFKQEDGIGFNATINPILTDVLSALIVDEAEISGHMDVSASTSDESHLKSDTAVDGEGKGGWGPVSVKVKIHSQVGVENSRKRASDYRAGVQWKVHLSQSPPPEGMMRVCDALMEYFDMIKDINMELARAEVDKIRAKAGLGPAPPPQQEAATSDEVGDE